MSPEELQAAVPMLVGKNVRLIGGCCGTTEKHIAALAAAVTFHRVSFGNKTGDNG
jgi:methionine synthase I (cobalamin-dependent)